MYGCQEKGQPPFLIKHRGCQYQILKFNYLNSILTLSSYANTVSYYTQGCS